MDSNQQMRRGMLWLGSASLVSRLIDAASTLALLWFLSREQMGVATLAATVINFVEAFSGMGVGTAILQNRERDHGELSSLFWYCCMVAVGLMLSMMAAAPWLADFYRAPELVPLLMLSATKLVFVGAAVVPQQCINRSLGFRRLGAVTTAATLLAAIVRIALAASGFGAWAPVIANTANGVFTFIGVYIAGPFWPAARFRWSAIREPVTFGVKVAGSGAIYHFYRNVDYLLVGRFLGMAPLGVYRVAFELAMSPAIAVLNVVNRTALPVFSRIADKRDELANAFLWNVRSLGLLLAPIVAVLFVGADDVLLAVGKSQWLAAAEGVRILSVAALLRSLTQVFSPVFYATGRPSYALYDSLWSMTVLVLAIAIALGVAGPGDGVRAVCYAWLASYPFVYALLWRLARGLLGLPFARLLAALRDPALGILASAAACGLVVWLGGSLPHAGLRFGLEIAAVLLAYLAFLRFGLGLRPRDVLRPPAASVPPPAGAGPAPHPEAAGAPGGS